MCPFVKHKIATDPHSTGHAGHPHRNASATLPPLGIKLPLGCFAKLPPTHPPCPLTSIVFEDSDYLRMDCCGLCRLSSLMLWVRESLSPTLIAFVDNAMMPAHMSLPSRKFRPVTVKRHV